MRLRTLFILSLSLGCCLLLTLYGLFHRLESAENTAAAADVVPGPVAPASTLTRPAAVSDLLYRPELWQGPAAYAQSLTAAPAAPDTNAALVHRVRELAQAQSEPAEPWLQVQATAYTAHCTGCTGFTYHSGIDVRQQTPKILAVDPDFIPFGPVEVRTLTGKSLGIYLADDIGSAIVGARVDVLLATDRAATAFGVQTLEVRPVPAN